VLPSRAFPFAGLRVAAAVLPLRGRVAPAPPPLLAGDLSSRTERPNQARVRPIATQARLLPIPWSHLAAGEPPFAVGDLAVRVFVPEDLCVRFKGIVVTPDFP
jgi:hypothetical protein